MTGLRLVVEGVPEGKGRPKFAIRGKGAKRFVHVYTPDETTAAEARIAKAWEDAGAVRLPDDHGVEVRVVLVHERPDGHLLKDGSLSAEGRRHPVPYRSKPDIDNALKLALDALNGRAWRDDVRVVRAVVERTWGETPRTEVEAHAVAAELSATQTGGPTMGHNDA